MSDLRRIAPPGKAPDRWLRASVAGVAVFVFLAIAKPWGSGGPPPVPFPVATPAGSPAATPHGLVRGQYDPALFGEQVPDPAWQLWPAGYVVDFGLAGPVTIDPPGTAAGSPRLPSPTTRPASPFGAADPVRLGGADNLVALGVNNPSDVHVDAIRLWRFDGRVTRRVAVSSLRSPWPTPHFHVIGIPSSDTADGLGPWLPGTYRLDLLTAPAATIRSIVLVIDPPGAAPSVAPSPAVDASQGEPAPLPSSVAGALAIVEPGGTVVELPVTGSATLDAACSLAALWLGETAAPGSRCAPIPAAGLTAVVVGRTGSNDPSIALRQLDPVVRDVAIDVAREAGGGAVATRADGSAFDDGFYQLDVTSGDGTAYRWYVDVVSPAR